MAATNIGKFYPGATEEQIIEIIDGVGELKGAKCEEIDSVWFGMMTESKFGDEFNKKFVCCIDSKI